MKKLQLELISVSPDETALEHRCADQDLAVERPVERPAVIEAIEQSWTVAFWLARWPSLHVVVFGLQHELLARAAVDLVDYLGAIDRPDVRDLMPLELRDLHIESSSALAG
jgi:hypothetical protein